MHESLVFLAICGAVYGAYALYSLGGFVDSQRDDLRRKEAELEAHIREGGVRGLLFRCGQPLVWLVTLPAHSVLAALGVAMLLVLPAVLAR